MSRKKLNLVCYRRSYILLKNFLLLPAFLNRFFWVYNGKSYSLFGVSSVCMFFLGIRDFILSKKIGMIHKKKEKKKGIGRKR